MTSFLRIALSVLILLTAHSFGAARGMHWNGEVMEICRGDGIALVPVPGDDNGRVHLCPDAAIAHFTDAAEPAAPVWHAVPRTAELIQHAAPQPAPTLAERPRVRGPPVV